MACALAFHDDGLVMRAGLLHQRITLQSVVETPDAYGDAVPVWTNYATSVPATVNPIRGNETNRSQEVQGMVSHKITIRYSSQVSGVTTRHRVLYDSRILDIRAVINVDERKKMIELECIERV